MRPPASTRAIAELVDQAEAAGAVLGVAWGGRLTILVSRDAVQYIEALREHEAAVVAHLRAREETKDVTA